eukprot:9501399-Alexandrium_andersonii.AAC.1
MAPCARAVAGAASCSGTLHGERRTPISGRVAAAAFCPGAGQGSAPAFARTLRLHWAGVVRTAPRALR